MKSMDEAIKQLPLLLVLLYLLFKAGNLELIVVPRDTEVLANYSTYFNCSTSIRNEQIHWYHHRVGENRTYYVYYKGQFNNMYSERYSIQINTETREYNLIISSVQPIDAGRYACQDDGGLGQQSSAELIVFDSTPVCLSNVNPEGLVGPNSCGLPIEELYFSCSVLYIGNIPPILQWKIEGDDTPISKGVASGYSGNRVTINLTRSSEVEMEGALFTCGTTRSQHKQHNCATGPIKINYAVDEPVIRNISKGETITCSANASVPCIYRWFYGNDTVSPQSCNHVLRTTGLEDYSCEASCPMNGLSCTFIAMRIFVFENNTSAASEDTTKTLLLAILIPTVVFLVITLLVLFFKLRKAKDANIALENQLSVMQTVMKARGQGIPETTTTDETNNEGNTLVGKRVEIQPLLEGGTSRLHHYIQEEITTKASKDMGRAISGVAILEDLIYVLSDKSSEVETFALETLEFKMRYILEELEDPWDLASSKLHKCLYIMDRSSFSKPKCVIGIDSSVNVLVRWSTGEEYGSLSVTSHGRVIVTFCDSNRLSIYGSNGTIMNVLSLPMGVIHPLHAIELSIGEYLVSCGLIKDNVHRMCVLNESFEIVKNTFEGMKVPHHMVVDQTGLIFVADQGNSRVCAFNTELELIEEVASKKHGLRSPQRIFFDENSGKLFVVDNEVLEFKRRNGKLLIFNYRRKMF